MTTSSAYSVVAGATLLVGAALAAAPPAVLVLDNQQVLIGEVEQVGGQYRVRRDGGETSVPAGRVLTVCPNLDAAYEFLRDKIAAPDADAHLQLARWCDANGLRSRAAAEAKLAADLSPGRAVVQATYQQLQRKAAVPAGTAPPAVLPPSVLSAPVEPIECGAEAFKRFATKVQPVLMNTCAACHAGTCGGKFRLERVYAGGPNARPATQQNLTAALAMIDRTKPAASPLLQKATAPHGGAALPPLRDRAVPAFKQLDEWVRLTICDTWAPPPPPADAAVVSTAAAAPGDESKTEFGLAQPKKDAPVAPSDPFDPAIFNQQYHPGSPKH